MANENHASSLVFIMIPVLAYVYLARSRRIGVYLGLCLLLVLYLFAVGSRAGMAISAAVAVLSLLWFLSARSVFVVRAGLVAGGLQLLFVVSFFLGFDDATAEEMRPTIFATTWSAIQSHWLIGSGLGSFPLIYPAFEAPDQILTVFINHAHNDYLEILLETGIAGVALIVLFFALIAINYRRSLLAEAAAVSILTLAIHSLVDYPLRTMALAVIFAFFVAVILSGERNSSLPVKERSSQRQRRSCVPGELPEISKTSRDSAADLL